MADDKLSWSEQVEKQANEIPDQVKNFILGFQQAIKDQNIAQITQNYDNNWNKLTDKFYKQTEWPSVDNVAPLVNEGRINYLQNVVIIDWHYIVIYTL